MDAENEEVSNEVIGTTNYYDSRTAVTGTTVYNLPELHAPYYSQPRFPTRDLPPLPVADDTDGPFDNRPTAMEMTNGVISSNSQTGDGMSSDLSPTSKVKTSYSRLESSCLLYTSPSPRDS